MVSRAVSGFSDISQVRVRLLQSGEDINAPVDKIGLQLSDATLTALAALNATPGFVVQTGADAFTKRTLQQPAVGFTIANPAGTAGDPTFALANDLAGLEGLGGQGIAVRTGADAWSLRTITQPVAGITVSNGNGASGNPTLALANDLGALEGLSSTGIAQRTGTDAWALLPYTPLTSWTPVLSFGTPGNLSVAYSTQQGSYMVLGGMCLAEFAVITSTFTHTTASGLLQITGLPISTTNTAGYQANGACQWRGVTKASFTDVNAQMAANTATVTFSISGSGQVSTSVVAADMPTGGTVVLRGTILFHT